MTINKPSLPILSTLKPMICIRTVSATGSDLDSCTFNVMVKGLYCSPHSLHLRVTSILCELSYLLPILSEDEPFHFKYA